MTKITTRDIWPGAAHRLRRFTQDNRDYLRTVSGARVDELLTVKGALRQAARFVVKRTQGPPHQILGCTLHEAGKRSPIVGRGTVVPNIEIVNPTNDRARKIVTSVSYILSQALNKDPKAHEAAARAMLERADEFMFSPLVELPWENVGRYTALATVALGREGEPLPGEPSGFTVMGESYRADCLVVPGDDPHGIAVGALVDLYTQDRTASQDSA